MSTNAQNAAFASDTSNPDGCMGLTKREYAAIAAMQGLMSNVDVKSISIQEEKLLAMFARRMADNLMIELDSE